MPDLVESTAYRFDDFLLCRQAGTLFRLHPGGHQSPVHIGTRAFQILCLLVDRRGEIVSRREIMDSVWPKAAVEQNNLTVQLTALRRVLDADRAKGSCIQNITGRGYRFVPTLTEQWPRPLDPVEGTLPEHDSHVARDDTETQPRPGRSGAKIELHAAWYTDRTAPSHAERKTALTVSAPTIATPAERPRLSLVVLPFSNLGGDGVDDATVDAITEDLTSDLGRVWGLFVISRGSAFTYKDKPIDIKRIGEELGVRYAVEGSVRKVEGALRVNAQLVSTETGAQVWADRFGIERDGLTYGVDDIVRQISHILNARLIDSESMRSARERPTNPDVTDLLLHARSLHNLLPNPQRQREMVALYERALALDPSSSAAMVGLAESLLDSIQSVGDDPTAAEKIRRADELAARAELLRPHDAMVMFIRVQVLGKARRCADVIPAAQRTIDAYPNITSPHMWLGTCLMAAGNAADAIPRFEQSIRLNPRNPYMFTRYAYIGYALLFLRRYDEAVDWFQKSLAANSRDDRDRGTTRAAIAAAQALSGRVEEARASAAEATRLWPMLTARSYYQERITNPIHLAQVLLMRDGLRLAGVRDHADEDADFGLVSDDALQMASEAPTPTSVPEARTVRTPDLIMILEQQKPLVLDTIPWGRSIPGAVGLWGAGAGGSLTDELQDRLRRKMQQLTGGNLTVPVVTMGRNSERFQGRNLALRLAALGYTDVYWYRGGQEAWEAAGLPTTELVVQNW